jgi:hypothetical protein
MEVLKELWMHEVEEIVDLDATTANTTTTTATSPVESGSVDDNETMVADYDEEQMLESEQSSPYLDAGRATFGSWQDDADPAMYEYADAGLCEPAGEYAGKNLGVDANYGW